MPNRYARLRHQGKTRAEVFGKRQQGQSGYALQGKRDEPHGDRTGNNAEISRNLQSVRRS